MIQLPAGRPILLILLCLVVVFRNRSIKPLFGYGLNGYLFYRMLTVAQSTDVVLTSDKINVKDYITQVIGSNYAVPTLAGFAINEIPDDIMFDCAVVAKPAHGSGAVKFFHANQVIFKSDLADILQLEYFKISRQFNYQSLHKRVVVEPLIFGTNTNSDYKLFMFRGDLKLVQVDTNRFSSHKRFLYNASLEPLSYNIHYDLETTFPLLPLNMKDMIRAAELLAKPFEFVRVDFYSNGKEFFVGELTHFPGGCGELVTPRMKQKYLDQIIEGD
jgi:hypothetical protein